MFRGITNKDQLATTPLRHKALDILEAGYRAIDTEAVIERSVFVKDNVLHVQDQTFALDGVEHVYVIGFGKASCEATSALEKVLGQTLSSGIAIDVEIESATCEIIDTYQADHPTPTRTNVDASQHVVDLAQKVAERDVVIVVVSGGGSSLLCWPYSECEQGPDLYKAFLKAGGTITELNTVRKHISGLKGGGLAALLYPAQVVGLIFSDVPGGELSDVASGPTFFDETTKEDARALLVKYGCAGAFDLRETPKDKHKFERVTNIPLVTNKLAFDAMNDAAQEMGFETTTVSLKMYDFAAPTLEQIWEAGSGNTVVFGGGEIRLVVDKEGGTGGRNMYLANAAMSRITNENELFIATASDGIDNCSGAGAIVDAETVRKATEQGLDSATYLNAFDSYTLFQKTEDVIMTGSTGANVADILVYIRT